LQGSKYSDETREKALALLAANDNASAVARELGLPTSTVASWRKEKAKDDKYADLRRKKQKAFINKAWEAIERSTKIAETRLKMAEKYTDELMELLAGCREAEEMTEKEYRAFRPLVEKIAMYDISDIMKVISTMYDKGIALEDRTAAAEERKREKAKQTEAALDAPMEEKLRLIRQAEQEITEMMEEAEEDDDDL
jgi:hypothetical protein